MDNVKDDGYYVKRILRSVEVLTRYLENKSLDDLLADGFLRDAIENRFTKIAEDSSHISKEFKNINSDIPWSAIITIRNKVCHDYDVVDAPTLYKTIKHDFILFRNNLLRNVKTHQMNLDPEPFDCISRRCKTVEMRLNDEKRQLLKIGDLIIFTNKQSKQQLTAEIVDLKQFVTFDELYAKYKKTELGYLKDEIANPNDMLRYYSKELIDKYGTLAIEISLY